MAEPESRQTKSDAPSQGSAPIAWSETPTAAAAAAHGLTAGDDAATRAPATLLLNQVQALSYVTVAGTPTYRAIVQVFFDAKQRYTIEMRPAELLAALRESGYCVETTSEDGLEYYLGQLVAWGNLARSHDTTAVARIEDFYRKRFLFGLTSVGEAAHRAVLDVEATVGKSGSLQSSMLVKIRDALTAVAQEAGKGQAADANALAGFLHDLHAAFETFTEEGNRFIGELSRATADHDTQGPQEEVFALRKQAVLGYISRFVDKLRQLATEIAQAIERVEAFEIETVVHRAAESSDLPPALHAGIDPAAAWRDLQLTRWRGVRHWFLGDPASAIPPTVERLASVAVAAVLDLARTLGRINDRRGGRLDRAADFRAMARFFAACESDEQAHGLWARAAGLYACRHFHLAEEDSELTAPQTSWWDAEPAAVPVRLRTRGTISKAGRASPAPDYSADKQWIALQRQRERAQVEAAVARFAGQGRMRISDIVALDSGQFDLFLALLDEALSAPRHHESARTAHTADGRLVIALRDPPVPVPVPALMPMPMPVPMPSEDEQLGAPPAWVTVQSPNGRLRCRNYEIEVTRAGVWASHQRQAVAGGAA